MKKILILFSVFILGILFGAGGFMLMHKYFIQNEAKEVVDAVEASEAAPEEVAFEENLKESAPSLDYIPAKVNIQELKPLEEPQKKTVYQNDDHVFFTLFSALFVIGSILAVAFGVNASHSDKTRDMSVFFGLLAVMSIFAAALCY